MQNTGDTSEYLQMTASCTSCASLADGVAEIYAGGGSVRNAGGKVTDVTREGMVGSVFIYEFEIETRPSAILDAKGEVETRLTGGSGEYQVNLVRSKSSWKVQRISRLVS